MLKLYATFLTLIFLAELVTAIVGFVFRHEIKNSFKSNYERALKYYNSTGDYRSEAIDKIQSMLHCCGVTDYRDWKDINYYSEAGFPKSCCKVEDCSPQRSANKLIGIFLVYCLSRAITNNQYEIVLPVYTHALSSPTLRLLRSSL
uniref:Tetraspanin-6 n=1 Tax=Castor canadensis TaxID=51338 RepID=A0A8C0WMX1_CASCN